jgi:hypothetical protein
MKAHRIGKTARAAGTCVAALSAAFFMTAAVTFSANKAAAEPVPCTGPFAQCVTAVGGWCDREADGKVTTWWRSDNSMRYEECKGKVYEANGQQNPYKPQSSQKPAPKR